MSTVATPPAPAAPAAPATPQAPAQRMGRSGPVFPDVSAAAAKAFAEPSAPPTPEPAKAEAPAIPAKTEAKAPPPSLLPKKTVKPDTTPAEPAPEADPFEKFSLPDNSPPEKVSQFTELKRIAREEAKQRKQLTAEIEALKKQPPTVANTAELDRLKAERQELLDKLAVVDLKSHPDFKRQYDIPRTEALAAAKEVLDFSSKGDIDLAALLTKPLKDFNATVSELTKEMDPMSANTVQMELRRAYKLSVDEKNALAKSGELSTQLQQKAQAQSRQAFEEVAKNLGPMGEFLEPLEADEGASAEEKAEVESYNQAVSTIRQQAEQAVFGRMDEKSMAMLAFKAATLDHMMTRGVPRMNKTYEQLLQSHQALTNELAAIKGKKSPGAPVGVPSGTPKAPSTAGMTPFQQHDAILAQVRASGAFSG